ncbi:MAG: elongation factor P [Phycisphaeraceae bacterium]|nr:elongation factor P [Phycisphaerales bacterium]MCB9861173.1 elongation factor P [Phycisphaeraceae bacterium]
MKAIDLRPGKGIRVDGKLCVVTGVEHRTPGNLRAFIQLQYKEVLTGKNYDRRFNPADDLEVAELDRRSMEFLFDNGSGGTFMDLETYDQFEIGTDVLGNAMDFLTPNLSVIMLCSEGQPISIELPSSVELEVTDTPPGIKGATATNQLKDATLETGLKTKVPPFIVIGEKVRVSTSDGSYQSRAKGDS